MNRIKITLLLASFASVLLTSLPAGAWGFAGYGGVAYGGGGSGGGGAPGVVLTAQAYFYYSVEVVAQDTTRQEVAHISFDYAF